MSSIVICGAGGHAKVVIDVIEKEGKYKVEGVIDPSFPAKESFLGYPILAKDDDIAKLSIRQGIVAVGNNWVRRKIVEKITFLCPDFRFITTIHPSSQIARDVNIMPGTVIMAGTVINTAAKVGFHSIVNTNASIDHDGTIGDFVSIAPNACLGGNVIVGDNTAISLGSNIIHNISIGSNSVIGAGSVVVRNIGDNVVAFGNPAKFVRHRNNDDNYL